MSFRGTRVPFEALLDYLEGGQTLNEFIDDLTTVTSEAAISALELARSVRRPPWMRVLLECIPREAQVQPGLPLDGAERLDSAVN